MTTDSSHLPVAACVVGLGSPLLADDAIGLHIVDAAELALAQHFPDVTFTKAYSGGFHLLDELAGFSCAVIVDAMVDETCAAGTCRETILSREQIGGCCSSRISDSHGLALPDVIAAAQRCGYTTPESISILTVSIRDAVTFSETPAPAVMAAVDEAVGCIRERLIQWKCDHSIQATTRHALPAEGGACGGMATHTEPCTGLREEFPWRIRPK
jgi:hydrogenase maturation protease